MVHTPGLAALFLLSFVNTAVCEKAWPESSARRGSLFHIRNPCFVGCNMPGFLSRSPPRIDCQLPWKPFATSTPTLTRSQHFFLDRHVLKAKDKEQELDSESKDERQQQLFERLLAADPADVDLLCSFAVFLQNVKQDYDRAAAMYEAALLADPVQAREMGLQLYDKPPQKKKNVKRRGEPRPPSKFAIRRPLVPRLAIGKISVPKVVLPRNKF